MMPNCLELISPKLLTGGVNWKAFVTEPISPIFTDLSTRKFNFFASASSSF